jgi:murein DD-endopeptidase MepM/ murein hydrolase activator NlpD
MLGDSPRRDSRVGGFLSRLGLWAGIAVVVAVAYLVWVKFEWSRPTGRLRQPLQVLGRHAEIALDVADRGTGLASVEVSIDAAGTRYQVLSETYPNASWRGSGIYEKAFTLPVAPRDAKMPEGPATLVVSAKDGSWLNLFRATPPLLTLPLQIDYTPPNVEALTSQHYMRLGGSDVVVYKVSKDAVRSGVAVERYVFPGTKGLLPDPDVAVALFAVPQDLTVGARPKIFAEDAAGNRRETDFWVSIKPRQFAERTLNVDDAFLQRKVPELLELNHLSPTDDLVAGYLEINRTLRQKSEETIRKVCSQSEPRLLWTEVFLRQPDSAPLSSFADRRTYKHDDKTIDSQTHLGFDLASLRQSPVIAENTGKVAFADNLGIYGNAVILDHGLGLFSLYGHLSSIGVAAGQQVQRGDSIGRTGETGLAAGDHLHFSIMVDGVHVDPVEWWDPKWVADHVTEKIRSFEHPTTQAPPASGASAEPAPAEGAARRARRHR